MELNFWSSEIQDRTDFDCDPFTCVLKSVHTMLCRDVDIAVKYSNVGKTLSDRFMHLTNYSINKNSDAYQPNNDAELCQGHKW